MKLEMELNQDQFRTLMECVQFCSHLSNQEMWQGNPNAKNKLEWLTELLDKMEKPYHQFGLCKDPNCYYIRRLKDDGQSK